MKQTVARVACSAAIVGVVLASDIGAQGRNALQERGPRRALPQAQTPASDAMLLLGSGSTIGLAVADPTADDLRPSAQAQGGGAVVRRVVPDSPAAAAGFVVGDVVVELDGERVRGAQQLTRLVRETPPGKKVSVAIIRDGMRRTLDVTPESSRAAAAELGALSGILPDLDRRLGALQRRFERRFDDEPTPGLPLGAQGRLGTQLSPLGEQLARYFGATTGVLIASVEPNSAASRAGLRAGDVVTAVDGQSVRQVSDVVARVRRAAPGATLELTVMRDKKEMSVRVTLPEDSSRSRTRSI